MSDEVPPDLGLVCGWLLDGRGGGQPLDWDGIAAWRPEQGLAWVHLDFTVENARRWLREESGIDPVIVAALVAEDSRPRSFDHGEGRLVVLRGVNLNPGQDPDDMVSIRIWLEPNRIISTRRRRLLSIGDLRDAIRGGTGPASAGTFLTWLVERLGDRIGLVCDSIDDRIDAAEAAVESGEAQAYRTTFSELRRQTARLRRYLAPQRDALDRLSLQPGPLLAQADCLRLREYADRMTRDLEDLDLARERAMVGQEEILAHVAHQQNSRIYLLSIVAALFLPLSFLTGLMGMNVAGLPGTENSAAFLVVCGIMLGCAAGILAYFWWRRWL